MSAPIVSVAVRRDKETGRPVLFFVNSTKDNRRQWIEGYDRIGQHSECHADYMRRACAPIPIDPLPMDALALVREWSTMAEPVNAIIRQRLTYRKG